MGKLDKSKKDWLKKEVPKWSEKGLISEYQIEDILGEYKIPYKQKKEEKSLNIVKVLATIGAILTGLGVILFVAANWQAFPRLFRALLLLTATFGTFYAGYHFTYNKKEHTNLGKTLIFLSTLLYGATIFLFAQMYNVNADSHWLVLFWVASIFPVAYYLESLPTYLTASFLLIIWDGLFNSTLNTANYFYPIIMFAIIIPLSKKREEILWLNIFGLAIAQIYALINGYHWLILLWASATYIYYLLEKNKLYPLITSILLIIWNIIWVTEYKTELPLLYLLPAGYLLYRAYKEENIAESIANIFGLWIWINLFIWKFDEVIMNGIMQFSHFIILNAAIGILLYTLGKTHEKTKYLTLSNMLQAMGILTALIISYIFSFRILQEKVMDDFPLFPYASCIILSISALLMLHYAMNGIKDKGSIYGMGLMAFLIFSIGVMIFAPQAYLLSTIFFNIFLFMAALAFIYYGFEENSVGFFNIGIFLFIILIITRYFDLFWGLLDRSIFFIGGGLLLLIGSVVLENKRRKAIDYIKRKK